MVVVIGNSIGSHVRNLTYALSSHGLNVSNASYDSVEQVLLVLGSTWFWDSFWLFVVPFVSLFGFATNLLSLYIFSQSQFQGLKIYGYLRIYVTSSVVLSFFTIFDFVFYSRRFLGFVNTYWASAYDCFIHEPITNTAYFYGSVLDICITLDRLSTFSKRFRVFPRALQPWKISLLALLVCVVVNTPYFFVNVPIEYNLTISGMSEPYTIYTIENSDFSTTCIGRVLTFVIYFIRDFLTMFVSIVLNSLSVVFLKAYLKKRAEMLSHSNSAPRKMCEKKNSMHENAVDRRVSLMVIVICTSEILEHLVIVASVLYGNFYDDMAAQVLERLADFVVIAKNALNFPVFILFNKLFANCFRERVWPLSRNK